MLENEVHELFNTMLQRDPDPMELLVYTPHTMEHARNLIENGREYLLLRNPDSRTEDISYDDASGISMSNPNPNKYVPVIVGNGKIFAYTSFHEEKMSKVGITHKFDFDTINTYQNNVYTVWDLFDNSFYLSANPSSSCTRSNPIQHLNMPEGYFRSVYESSSYFESEGTPIAIGSLKVQKTLRALRQYPYTFHSRHVLEQNNSHLPETADIRNEWTMCHKVDSLLNAKASLYTLVNISGVNMMCCECDLDGVFVAACAAYKVYSLQEDGLSVDLECLVDLEENESGGKSRLNFVVPNTGKLVVESFITLMTSNDFSKPDLECKRISLAVMADEEVVLKHSQLWSVLWRGRLKIDAATGVSETEQEGVRKHNSYTKNTLYTLYSKLRDDINPDANPLNMSVIDDDGSIFWEGEMYIVPLMLIFNPKMAKIILNFRYNQLENAKNIALVYGYKGAKFPYVGESSAYSDTYWSSTKPLYIHNTALVGINTWNYYRTSSDLDWMFTKGYKILKNTTRFLLDMLDLTYSAMDVIVDIRLRTDTLDMNGNLHSPTNTFLMYMIFLNLKYTLEATYELRYTAQHTNWYTVYNAMVRLYRIENRSDIALSGINPVFNEEVNFQFDFRDPRNGMDVRTKNGELHFTSDTYIGFAFGGETGRTILIDPVEDYRFNVEGQPLGLYKESGNESVSKEGDNIAGYFLDGGVFVGSELRSFKGKYTKPYFGTNAFDHESKTRTHKVVKIDTSSAAIDLSGKREEYLMMHHFYSRELFNLVIDSNERIQVIKNTLDYFMRHEDNHFNRLNEAVLYAYIGQKMQTREAQETCLRVFDQILLRHIDETTRFGWGVDKASSLGLFAYVCGLFGVHPRGAINQVQFIIEPFGVGIDNSSALPNYWSSLTMNAHNNKSYLMKNVYRRSTAP